MARSNPFDFEFDISDLEVEEQSPSSIERVLEARRQSLGLPPDPESEPAGGEESSAQVGDIEAIEDEQVDIGAEGHEPAGSQEPSNLAKVEPALAPDIEEAEEEAEQPSASGETPSDELQEASPEDPHLDSVPVDQETSLPVEDGGEIELLAELQEEASRDEESEQGSPRNQEQQPDRLASEEAAAESHSEVADQPPSENRLPSPDDLLRHASSILNGASAPPPGAASDKEGAEEEEIMAMPDPQALMDEARHEANAAAGVPEDAEKEIAELPDPQEMMAEAQGEVGDDVTQVSASLQSDEDLSSLPDPQQLMQQARREDAKERNSRRVVDRGGELPPPPPPPIAIDDDVTEEDFEDELLRKEEERRETDTDSQAANEAVDEVSGSDSEEEKPKDPFSIDDGLDGFNVNLEATELEDDLAREESDEVAETEGETASRTQVFQIEPAPKAGLLRRAGVSLAWAAAFVFMGLAGLAFAFKQEIAERVAGYDLDGSELATEIQLMARQVLEGLNEDGLYYMKTVDSEITRVAPEEIRIRSHVFAQLNRNLYLPVTESELFPELAEKLERVEAMQRRAESEATGPSLPRKPWNSLYRVAVPRYKVIPLRVSYTMNFDDKEDRWSLTGISIKGDDGRPITWPAGMVKERFPGPAFDVESREFKAALANFTDQLDSYASAVQKRQNERADQQRMKADLLARERGRIVASLEKGAYFEGMAISGADAFDTRRVSMIVTETRENGAFIKGVFRLDGDETRSKRFTGLLDFEAQSSEGSLRGSLKVTTVGFEGESKANAVPPFFHPGSVSRIELMTDGHLMEGDNTDISLRLVRGS